MDMDMTPTCGEEVTKELDFSEYRALLHAIELSIVIMSQEQSIRLYNTLENKNVKDIIFENIRKYNKPI
ncbi:hypothetical protein SIM32_28585 [Bacillus cereus group sp. WSBC 10925]|uniref:Uncharacterized protein n=2 Tax=root TaxID=1 RepID=A0A7D8D7J1_9BACI|nr:MULTISPECIES: hypothetical protein [Bacillus cereus group]AFX65208.1 hypothetical protein [Bacillus phage Emet]KXI93442.1 hypothetical protein ACS46_06185 [Bacillus cereus]MDX5788318.1 hypothetical protein [Bacillus cereus group sp. WSBC 10925]MDX5830028.1 hypothetical protein [Bacillus cereus group sp. BfR-BA-02147]SMD61434.1 hypothetical protein BACERE00174_00347 [Bacillus paranthracis]